MNSSSKGDWRRLRRRGRGEPMSDAFDNVVGGKLKLKGGIGKKKKKSKDRDDGLAHR